MNVLITGLLRNVVFSGAAFVVVGLIGLFLIPIVIQTYGLNVYGVVVLARIVLPSGFFGLFDCGVTELATKRAAQQRSGATADAAVAPVVALATAVGLLLAAMLLLLNPWLPGLLMVKDAALASGFRDILLVSALALPILFFGLAIEGIVRGHEQFLIVRAAEICSALTYAGLTLGAIALDAPYVWIAYAFVLGALLKVVVLLTWVLRQRALDWRACFASRRGPLVLALQHGSLFTQSRVVGTLQTQLPVVLVGMLTGPAGAAAYDVVTRLPRFLKTVLSLTVSVVFPVSARLDAGGEQAILSKLLVSGLAMVMFCLYPIIAAAIFLSESVLQLWIGPELGAWWPWMALMFFALATNLLLSYALAIGMVRVAIQRQTNRLFMAQVVLQFAVSLIAVAWLGERAFILGQALAMLVFFPIQIKYLFRQLDIVNARLGGLMFRHLCVFVGLAALAAWLASAHIEAHSLFELAVFGLVVMATYAVLAYLFVLDAGMRGQFKRVLTLLRSKSS